MEFVENNYPQSNGVISTLINHVSIRNYTEDDIDDSLLRTILQAGQRSPTSSNMQAYSIVVVKDKERKARLSELSGGQRHVANCAVFLAICADISRLDVAHQIHGTSPGKNLENTIVATVDASLIGMSIATAAESFGLGTCMIGGMRNYPKQVAEFLNFPPGVFLVYGLTMGWPDPQKENLQKPRMPLELIVHEEQYNQDNVASSILNYDAQLAQHYRNTGRETPDAAWSGIISERFSQKRRPHLHRELEELGFSFE